MGRFSNLSPKLVAFAAKLSAVERAEMANPVCGRQPFWMDTSLSALKFAPFNVERKVKAPFHEKSTTLKPQPTAARTRVPWRVKSRFYASNAMLLIAFRPQAGRSELVCHRPISF